jgi:Na+/H+ antiporter NhaC
MLKHKKRIKYTVEMYVLLFILRLLGAGFENFCNILDAYNKQFHWIKCMRSANHNWRKIAKYIYRTRSKSWGRERSQ